MILFLTYIKDVLSAKEWIDFNPDIIGLSSLFTPSYYNMIDLAQVLRQLFPKALIVAGGGVPTNMYNEIFRDSKNINALCFGEGEKPLLGLIKVKNKDKFLKSHSSWITKEKVRKKQTYQYDFINNLDKIPFYDYDLLSTDDYSLSPTISSYASFNGKKRIFHYVTSRGCPHHCCFCASNRVHGRVMRYHSVFRVKRDLKHLQDKYKADIIGFQDDNFMINKNRAIKIIKFAKKLKIKFFFQSGLALYALDRKTLEIIKSVGIKELVLAVESGSDRVLREIMHKPLVLSIVRRVVKDCRELGIDTDANILIGLPGETKQDIEDTRTFLKSLDASWFRIYVATPLVGSEMFDICMKKHYLKGNYIGCDFKRAVVETEDFTSAYIQKKVYSLNLELNFVNNSDFRLGNYEKALKGFENTIRVKNDHAIAYYFAAKCYKKMSLNKKYKAYKTKYQEIVRESPFWKKYAKQFNLVALN